MSFLDKILSKTYFTIADPTTRYTCTNVAMKEIGRTSMRVAIRFVGKIGAIKIPVTNKIL